MAYTINDKCNGCDACVRICPVNAIAGEKKGMHVIDPELCIECGACGRVCPEGAVEDSNGNTCVRIKRSEWEKPRINLLKCMSCEICIDACPVACLGMRESINQGNPHQYPFLEKEKVCIGCGFCDLECPVDAITMAV